MKSYFVVGENKTGKVNTKGMNATERKYFSEVRSRLNAEFVTLTKLNDILSKPSSENIEVILSRQFAGKESVLREKYPNLKIMKYKSFFSDSHSQKSIS